MVLGAVEVGEAGTGAWPSSTVAARSHPPYQPFTLRPNVCPICGCVEHVHVNKESRQRDVSEDRWALTPLGQALLDGLRALEQGGKSDT